MRVICVLNVMLLAAATSAHATTIVPADLGELSRDAVAIVHGRVAEVRSQWTEDRGTVETIVTLEVEEYLKGSFGAVVRFRVQVYSALTQEDGSEALHLWLEKSGVLSE